MKIGILTQPLHSNYGGLLQNYALQKVLKGMGHEVETIDWEAKSTPLKRAFWRLYRCMTHFLGISNQYRLTDDEKAVILQNTSRFVKTYISVSPQRAHFLNDFRRIGVRNEYNAFVVGSDQVWRPGFNPMLLSMFLDFTNGMTVKRVAYAASFGTSKWEYSPAMTRTCSQLLRKFDLVTVREKSGVEMCKEHLGVEAVLVLDPTLLLNKEDYESIVMTENAQVSEGTLFHYILDPSDAKRKLTFEIASYEGLIPFTVMPKCQAENRSKWDVKNRIEDCVFPGVTSWLRGFMDAKMVLVDSFHGAVFSIIFNKPFWVIKNEHRGNARFENLLELFGLEDRLLSIDSIKDSFDWGRKINWARVNTIRERERMKSYNLLYSALQYNDIIKK